MKESYQDESGTIYHNRTFNLFSLWSNGNNTTLKKVRFAYKQLVIIVSIYHTSE